MEGRRLKVFDTTHGCFSAPLSVETPKTKDQRPKSTTVSIGSNEMIEATKVKTFRCIGMQMVPATQLTPLPKQACLAKASCNLSTCSDLLGQCWLHVISMTSFFNGIQQFQGLCTLRPRQFQIKEKLQSY